MKSQAADWRELDAAPRAARIAPRSGRTAFTWLELIIAVAVAGLLLIVAQRALLHAREVARKQTCADHLRQFHLALQSYHGSFNVLPPAATWRIDNPQDVLRTNDVPAVCYQNWIQLLLPSLNEPALMNATDIREPIGSPANESVRMTPLERARCPSDEYHRTDNLYQAHSPAFGPVEFARGNYAINGGTQRMAPAPGTTADPVPGGFHLEQNPSTGWVACWGNGVAGINKCFSLDEIDNGLATTVVIDEVRAGIHPHDSRGVWSLGQIGGSITWAHGMSGDAGGPNDSWKRADDIAGCSALHEVVGAEQLEALNMPCCSYCVYSEQATSRSRHPGGVHVLTLDGAVHFLSDEIDRGIWHVIHSRETPAEVLNGRLAQKTGDHVPARVAQRKSERTATAPVDRSHSATLTNSIGMQFVRLPPGRFIMGLPDEELNAVFELDGTASAHWVEITRPTWLGTYEVTRGEYAAVMQNVPILHSESNGLEPDRLPVADVTWDNASAFCRRLSALPAEVASGRSYRLPTEAEWEYACRSGSTEPHIYVPERQPSDRSGENAMKKPPLLIHEVGSFPPNEFGLHDLRGNVWEWCADWSHPDYYSQSPEHDPPGPLQGYLKVVRGSDWLYAGQRCMLGFRATEPWLRSPFIGFRVVCDVREQP